MPRMPPPSIVNRYRRGIHSPFYCFPQWLTLPHLSTFAGGDESAMNLQSDLAWHLSQ
jgi:hypothetical protein